MARLQRSASGLNKALQFPSCTSGHIASVQNSARFPCCTWQSAHAHHRYSVQRKRHVLHLAPTTSQAAHRSEHAQPALTSRCAKGNWAHTPSVRNTMACCSRERN